MSRLQAARGADPIAGLQEGPDRAAIAPPSRARLYLLALGTASIVVGLDQVTKELALDALSDGPVHLIEGAVSLRLTLNPGGAFGVLQGIPGFFLVAGVGISLGILLWIRRLEDSRWAVPLGMILGGGVGNLADRLFRDTEGRVVDFIDLHVWPVFNLADSAIVLGVAVILLLTVRTSGNEPAAGG